MQGQSDQSSSWPKYTITALLGVVCGVAATFTNITISNQARIAAVEVEQRAIHDSLRRIEMKLEKLH